MGPKSVALDSTQKPQSQCRSGENEQCPLAFSQQAAAACSPAEGQVCGLEAPELLGLRIRFTQVGSATDIRFFLKVSTPFLRI